MKLSEAAAALPMDVLTGELVKDAEISTVYTCDLLSRVMSMSEKRLYLDYSSDSSQCSSSRAAGGYRLCSDSGGYSGAGVYGGKGQRRKYKYHFHTDEHI